MAADRGYIWDDPRNAWTRSTLSHNIVTVDAASQRGHTRGRRPGAVWDGRRRRGRAGLGPPVRAVRPLPAHLRPRPGPRRRDLCRRPLPRRRRPPAPVRLPLQRPPGRHPGGRPGAGGRGDRVAPQPARRPAAAALHRHLAQRGGAHWTSPSSTPWTGCSSPTPPAGARTPATSSTLRPCSRSWPSAAARRIWSAATPRWSRPMSRSHPCAAPACCWTTPPPARWPSRFSRQGCTDYILSAAGGRGSRGRAGLHPRDASGFASVDDGGNSAAGLPALRDNPELRRP